MLTRFDVKGLNEEQLKMTKAVFDQCDLDGDGYIGVFA
jgi:hypothetical protein